MIYIYTFLENISIAGALLLVQSKAPIREEWNCQYKLFLNGNLTSVFGHKVAAPPSVKEISFAVRSILLLPPLVSTPRRRIASQIPGSRRTE